MRGACAQHIYMYVSLSLYKKYIYTYIMINEKVKKKTNKYNSKYALY